MSFSGTRAERVPRVSLIRPGFNYTPRLTRLSPSTRPEWTWILLANWYSWLNGNQPLISLK
jgi:hypothetical protein